MGSETMALLEMLEEQTASPGANDINLPARASMSLPANGVLGIQQDSLNSEENLEARVRI